MENETEHGNKIVQNMTYCDINMTTYSYFFALENSEFAELDFLPTVL